MLPVTEVDELPEDHSRPSLTGDIEYSYVNNKNSAHPKLLGTNTDLSIKDNKRSTARSPVYLVNEREEFGDFEEVKSH